MDRIRSSELIRQQVAELEEAGLLPPGIRVVREVERRPATARSIILLAVVVPHSRRRDMETSEEVRKAFLTVMAPGLRPVAAAQAVRE